MSHPEPTYFGENGEVTARLRPDGTEPDTASPGGTRTHYLATGASTHGQFGVYRWEMGPKPSGPADLSFAHPLASSGAPPASGRCPHAPFAPSARPRRGGSIALGVPPIAG